MNQFPMIIKPDSKVLVVGQNPGQSQSKEEDYEFENAKTCEDVIMVYEKWFKRCRFYHGLWRPLCSNWLDTGMCSYTALVRERTYGNARPSNEQIAKYLPTVLAIIERFDVVIAVGSMVRDNLRGHHPSVVAISHPASFATARKRHDDIMNVKETLFINGIKLIDTSASDNVR